MDERGLLTDMALELANLHLESAGLSVEISIDLDRHDPGWLLKAVQFEEDDFFAFTSNCIVHSLEAAR